MNRIYQGRARRAELIDDKGHPVAAPANWDGLDALWQHHALFQDAVNYYVVCLLALAQPGSALWPIREKLDAKNEAGGDDELMVWRTFRRRGAMRRGLRDSVVPYICPDKKDATPEDCFAAVLAGNECAQSEERKKRLDAGLRQILKNCTGESGCRDSSKEYLPRLCRTKTRCNYPESAISRRRAYHEQLLPLVLHSAVSASSEVWKGFNTFSIALPDYEKPFYAGDEAKQLLRKMIADLRAKFSKDAADFARLAAVVDAKSPATRIPGYAATSAKEEKKFRLYAMYLFRYVERSEFTLRLLRATTPAPEKDARFAHTVHSEPRPDSALFDEFDTEVIAKCDKTKPVFGADEAAAKLQQMVDEWRDVLPDAEDDWQRLSAKAAVVQIELPSFSGVQRAKELAENRRLRLFAFYLFKYVERSDFTLRLLRAATPALTPPTRAEMAAGDPVQKSRGARGFVFRAFTALPCWGAEDSGEPLWLKFDEAALQEALKALHQIEAKKEERDDKRADGIARLEYQRQCTFRREKQKDGSEVVNLNLANAASARKKWKAQAEGEGVRPPVLASDPRVARLEELLTGDLAAEYAMSEGVPVEYGLRERTIRGFRDVRKKWNDALPSNEERDPLLSPEAEFTEDLRTKLRDLLTDYKKENAQTIGSPVLFDALHEKQNWIIWREPTSEQIAQWRTAAKLPGDADFSKDPLQALTDERELIEEIKRLAGPIRFTPADPEHSRRQFYFSEITDLTASNRLRHDRQTVDVEIVVAEGGVWKRKDVRLHFTAPRLLRDQLNNTGGSDAAWQQAMMAPLDLKAGLTKKGKTVQFEDCAAVALMPELNPTPEQRSALDKLAAANPSELPSQWALVRKSLLLNFPIELDAVEIPKRLLTLKQREDQFRTKTVAKKVVLDSFWERQSVASYKGGKVDAMFHLRWPASIGEAKRTEHGWWWEKDYGFTCLSVDLGQRDAGAFALLEASPGDAPKPQSRKLGTAEGKTWWATVRATGMLHLPGEDAKVMRDGQWQEELSGGRGRNLVEGEWTEARDICEQLGFVPDKMLGTDERRRSFPELNNELLYALRRAQARLARLQSWSCVAYEEADEKKRAAFDKRRTRIKEQITEAIASREAEEKKSEKDRGLESLTRSAWLGEEKPFVEKQAWALVAECIKREIGNERAAIERELLRIADRIQPLRGRRWEWAKREDGSNCHVLRQAERGTDDRRKLLAGQRGLSMKRIEQLESLRQRCQSFNRALTQEPGVPAKLGRSKRGIELPDPCPELLDRLEALKDQRVNQTAHLILAQALGVRLKAHERSDADRTAQDIHGEYERIPGREPVDFLVLENLDRYLASQGRGRGENSKLMKWSHRAILGKLKQLCEPYGLRVLETPASYSSRFCSLTGVAGFRAVELTPDDAEGFRWKKHLDRLADPERAAKLSREEKAESLRVKELFSALEQMNANIRATNAARPKWRTLLAPVAGGPIFVPASAVELCGRKNPKTGISESVVCFKQVAGRRPVVGQADINAAINLGLRAIAAPDADDIHLRIRAARKEDGFVVRAENKREIARWGTKPPEVSVPDETNRKKLLADAHLNFFADLGGVADYDRAEIDGKSGYASGRGIWGTIKNGKDWLRVQGINAARLKACGLTPPPGWEADADDVPLCFP